MKIEWLVSIAGTDFSGYPGQVAEVETNAAKQFIKSGLAKRATKAGADVVHPENDTAETDE